MLRRPLSLPDPDDVPLLAALIASGPITVPRAQGRRLAESAVRHGVAEYLVRATAEGRLILAADARHWLMAVRSEQQAQDAARREALPEILAVLGAATRVPALLIKGLAVAELFYDDRRLRPASDLDLVVPAGELGHAVGALEAELGYRRMPEAWPGYGERHGHHVALTRPSLGPPVIVELHWRVSDDPAAQGLDYARLAAHAEPLRLAGAEAWVPGASEHLLVLAVHLLHERGKRLMWINDIALVARGLTAEEKAATLDLARGLGLLWVLERALAYVSRHLEGDSAPAARRAAPPPPGPLRVSERLDGWVGHQTGRLALGGWSSRDGYLRSAARARGNLVLRAVRRPRRLW